MKIAQALLILLFLLVANSQNLQAEVQNTIYSPYKDMCNPILMRRLANPSSTISDKKAFQRLLDTLRFAPDPQTVLNQLSFYTPRFVGLLITYVQQKHLLLKQAQATDPAIRSKCLSKFKIQDCTKPCQAQTIATPQDSFDIPCDSFSDCSSIEADDDCFLSPTEAVNLIGQLFGLEAYQQAATTYYYNLLRQQSSSQPICEERSQLNFYQSMECLKNGDNKIRNGDNKIEDPAISIEKTIEQFSRWLEENSWQDQSMMDLGIDKQQSDHSDDPDDSNNSGYDNSDFILAETVKKNVNLESTLNAVRNIINLKFGWGVFEEKSLKCLRGEYLLMQTL